MYVGLSLVQGYTKIGQTTCMYELTAYCTSNSQGVGNITPCLGRQGGSTRVLVLLNLNCQKTIAS